MKAVILAAGKGQRMFPLTLKTPKPLLAVGNKMIIDHIFDALPLEIDEVIIVVGYLREKIQERLGLLYRGKSVKYVIQDILNGSASALLCSQKFFLPKERFLVIYGDELPLRQEIEECLQYQYSWLCAPVDDPFQAGIVITDKDGFVAEVVEKPEKPTSNMSAAGILLIDSDIFSYTPAISPNGEYYLTSLMNQFVKNHKVRAVFGRPRPPFISPNEIEKIKF